MSSHITSFFERPRIHLVTEMGMLKPKYEAQKVKIYDPLPDSLPPAHTFILHQKLQIFTNLQNTTILPWEFNFSIPIQGLNISKHNPVFFQKTSHVCNSKRCECSVHSTRHRNPKSANLSSRSLPIAHTYSPYQKLIQLVERKWG
jgi:hypothetical protein